MMRLFISVISFLFLIKAQSQNAGIYQSWYQIGFEGLMQFTFTKSSVRMEEQTFLLKPKAGKKGEKTIIGSYKRGNLICFIEQDRVDDDFVFRAIVIRESTVAGVLDGIMNCTDDDYRDTTTLKKSFYSCDSPKFMIMRFYDRKTIGRFQALKNLKNITGPDYKKTYGLYGSAVSSLKKQFSKEDLWFTEPFLRRQMLTDILATAGYNPLIKEEELKKFFSLY